MQHFLTEYCVILTVFGILEDFLLGELFAKVTSEGNAIQTVALLANETRSFKSLDKLLSSQQVINVDFELPNQDIVHKLKSIERVTMPTVTILDDNDGFKLDLLLDATLGWQDHFIIAIGQNGTLTTKALPFSLPTTIQIHQIKNNQVRKINFTHYVCYSNCTY